MRPVAGTDCLFGQDLDRSVDAGTTAGHEPVEPLKRANTQPKGSVLSA